MLDKMAPSLLATSLASFGGASGDESQQERGGLKWWRMDWFPRNAQKLETWSWPMQMANKGSMLFSSLIFGASRKPATECKKRYSVSMDKLIQTAIWPCWKNLETPETIEICLDFVPLSLPSSNQSCTAPTESHRIRMSTGWLQDVRLM